MTDHQSPSSLSETAATIRDEAATLGTKAADTLASAADARKSSLTGPMHQVSDAIDAAADKLAHDGQSTPAWVASGLRTAASGVSDFAQRIEASDSKQILSEVQDFARQRPAVFLAGCAALGFAAARVLRAGVAPSPQDGGHNQSPLGGDDQSSGTWGADHGGSSGQTPGFAGGTGNSDYAAPPTGDTLSSGDYRGGGMGVGSGL